MKKILLLFSIVCLASSALAASVMPSQDVNKNSSSSDTEIKFEGFFNFQSGFSKQNHLLGFEKNVSDNRKKFAFYTEAAFFITASQQFNDVIAGAKIVLLPTTKAKTSVSYNGSHIFLDTEYGRVELGSPHDAGAKMRVTGYSIIAATGTNWSNYVNLAGAGMKYLGLTPDFDACNNFYTESFVYNFDRANDKTEAARKISYYTPQIKGFQFGISYTPDSANTGGGYVKHLSFDRDSDRVVSSARTAISVIRLVTGNSIILNRNVKDAWSAGISYKYEISDDIALKVAVTGEYGKAAKGIIEVGPDKKTIAEYKLSDLKACNLGAILTYGNFEYAASYGSLGKSLTSKEYHKVGRNTSYYNASIAYGQGPIKTSLAYFKSLRYKNTIDSITLGTEYKITSGVVPYAEIAYFQAKGKPVYYVDAPKKKTRGTVALLGAKLKF